MGRKILFITTDQMRYDALGCNGGRVARTPVLDAVAKKGIVYRQATTPHVVCMPARASMITGQYPRTHGVWMNGVPLPENAPSAARLLHNAGYRTALLGKAHFEPWMGSSFFENRMAGEKKNGPHRGFEHMELANHFILGHAHYDQWMQEKHPQHVRDFYPILDEKGRQNAKGGGETSAVQCWRNPIPREIYHTDWIAGRTIDFLKNLSDEEDWFVWMSFPDPHHPWDPPESELGRVNWRDVPLPAGYPQTEEARRRILEEKPGHWLETYLGKRHVNMEMPPGFIPAKMTSDQVKEINAFNHIENELIDEACGRVLRYLDERGWTPETDILFTTDHGELQGDFGLMFKGPYHVDALMRLPFLWQPAPCAKISPCEVAAPVSHVDLAPTFCAIAGIDAPEWMQGSKLPADEAEAIQQDRQRALTEWDSVSGMSETPIYGIEDAPADAPAIGLRTIRRDGFLCTAYAESNLYEGDEGELYDLKNDPLQQVNLWKEKKSLRSDLMADFYDSRPPLRKKRLARAAPF